MDRCLEVIRLYSLEDLVTGERFIAKINIRRALGLALHVPRSEQCSFIKELEWSGSLERINKRLYKIKK